jgi:hypothetical protein
MSLNVLWQTSHIISDDLCSLSNSITNYKCSWLWRVNNTWIKCPISCYKTLVQMCDKDILQLFFEDLNQSVSPLKISYHYTSSVTVSSSNRHAVCAGCLLPRHVLHGHLDPWRWDWLFIPKCQNGINTLCCVQSQKLVGLKTCSISMCLSIRRMENGWI